MAVSHRVGGEVDTQCTRCRDGQGNRLTLAHTILAMVGTKIARVKCNTCGGEHAYHAAEASKRTSSAPRAPRAAAAKEEKLTISFEQRLMEKDVRNAKPYSVKQTFAVDDLISHPTFGVGIVTAARPDKIDVDFKASQKTLVHGRGEGPVQHAQFSRPDAKHQGPADKPVQEQEEAQPSEPSQPE